MTRSLFVFSGCGLLLAGLLELAVTASAAERPNVLLIVADDLG